MKLPRRSTERETEMQRRRAAVKTDAKLTVPRFNLAQARAGIVRFERIGRDAHRTADIFQLQVQSWNKYAAIAQNGRKRQIFRRSHLSKRAARALNRRFDDLAGGNVAQQILHG